MAKKIFVKMFTNFMTSIKLKSEKEQRNDHFMILMLKKNRKMVNNATNWAKTVIS